MQNPVIEYAVEHYGQSLAFASSYGVPYGDVADVYQDAVERLLRKERAVRNAPAYWWQCLRNSVSQYFRRPRTVLSLDFVDDEGESLANVIAANEGDPEQLALAADTLAAVRSVPMYVAEREALERKLADLPARGPTDRVNLHRARKKLRLALA
jgi:DNA-directed RNA polymerase specialized sigma24 family protein